MATKIEKLNEKAVEKRFKLYDQDQVLQVPISIGSLIPKGHLVRIVDKVVEDIDMSSLSAYYPGGGSSP